MIKKLQQRIPGLAQLLIGALVGIVILHPLVTLIFWFEFNQLLAVPSDSVADFLWKRISGATIVEIGPMTLVFAGLGIVSAMVFKLIQDLSEDSEKKSAVLRRQMNDQLPLLIAAGESEITEFKETMRWDVKENRVNKALEKVIAKSLAGLMNHRGGNLLIGLSDDGGIEGIEPDCKTLKHKNRDGFERALIDLVKNQLGANVGTMVHIQFLEIGGNTVCWIIVDAASEPVYFKDGNNSKYYVRLGNSTRELDVREANLHIKQRDRLGKY